MQTAKAPQHTSMPFPHVTNLTMTKRFIKLLRRERKTERGDDQVGPDCRVSAAPNPSVYTSTLLISYLHQKLESLPS